MGALQGHMNHLYDNGDLTFGDIKNILSKASAGELEGTEKVDGQNIMISYSVPENKAKAARNKGNIKAGGLDAQGLADKFASHDNPNLRDAFVKSFQAFEKAAASLDPDAQSAIFGADANIWYNAEVMDPASPNVVNYDVKGLVIHQQGHTEYDRETGQVTDKDVSGNVEALRGALERMQTAIQGDDYQVQMNAIRNLKALDNDEALKSVIAAIDKMGGNDGMSIDQYMVTKLGPIIDQRLPDLPDQNQMLLLKRMLGVKGVKLTDVYKGLDKDGKVAVRELVGETGKIKSEIIRPLENAIHDFAVAMLKGLQSAFILDNKKEVKRLQGEVAKAIQGIEAAEDNAAHMKILQKQMEKLKAVENVETASEGFVFDWDGITYKFTGNFAPMNQILGLFKYGRGEARALGEAEGDDETATGGRVIAIVPGGFKPPHAGHFLGAKWFLDAGKDGRPAADMVHVLISPKPRAGHCGETRLEIKKEQSLRLWKLYIAENGLRGKIIASIATSESPVKSTYDFMEQMEQGTIVMLGKGEKDESDHRFKNAQAWADKKQLGITVEQVNTPMMAGGVSGTQMRDDFIACGKKEEFAKFTPLKNPEAINLAWEIVRPDLVNEPQPESEVEAVAESFRSADLFRLINEALDEINNVQSGNVSGYAGQAFVKKQKKYKQAGFADAHDVSSGSSGEIIDDPHEEEAPEEVRRVYKELKGPGIVEFPESLGVAREEMPQISSGDVQDFRSWLESQGVASKPDKVSVADLKPIQKELNMEKVDGMMQAKSQEYLAFGKPAIISSDNYLVDGHHRWWAVRMMEEGGMFGVIRVDMPIRELLELAREYPKVSYKGALDESESIIEEVLNLILEKAAPNYSASQAGERL